jgi:effector-binding domain-containing protein
MIDPPQFVNSEAQPAAVIRLKIPRSEIQAVMGPAMAEVVAAAQAQGIGPAGPLFSHHFRMTPDVFDFEVGVPVTGPVKPVSRVQPGALPAARVVRTVYHGGYEGLAGGWGEFDAWLQANSHPTAANLWERYLTGPETSPNPADWRTELNRPLG